MQDTYRSFVHAYAPRFAQLFQLLLESQDPLVFHCTAGKDRTGWAAALLLTALGVDEDTVMQDYLLTNQLYRRPATTFAPMPAEVMDVLWRVQASYLAAATDMVRADFGGMEGYLRDALGIDSAARERLAALYLEA
jgi:protein-tyrosine phosphatase